MIHVRSLESIRAPRLGLAIATLLTLWAPEAFGHDYWLAQEPWSLEAGDICTMRMLVGDNLESEIERPLQVEMTTRYQWYTPEATVDLMQSAVDGSSPVFQSTVAAAGQSLLVMDRRFHEIESTVGGFLEFLEHEGQLALGNAYKTVDPEQPLTRRYARNIKALVHVGEPTDGEFHSMEVDQHLEVRLMQAPSSLGLGDPVTVHVQFQGDDLADHPIKVLVQEKDGTVAVVRARTNEQGRVEFPLDRHGLWVIRVAYLEQCEDCDIDWDTYYSTFSFVYPSRDHRASVEE